jgi:hypothetical protein
LRFSFLPRIHSCFFSLSILLLHGGGVFRPPGSTLSLLTRLPCEFGRRFSTGLLAQTARIHSPRRVPGAPSHYARMHEEIDVDPRAGALALALSVGVPVPVPVLVADARLSMHEEIRVDPRAGTSCSSAGACAYAYARTPSVFGGCRRSPFLAFLPLLCLPRSLPIHLNPLPLANPHSHSIATVHASRRHRVLAAQTLRALSREAEGLRRVRLFLLCFSRSFHLFLFPRFAILSIVLLSFSLLVVFFFRSPPLSGAPVPCSRIHPARRRFPFSDFLRLRVR